MGSNITYDCNAGMERAFIAKAGDSSRNISDDNVYDVYFEIVDSETGNERRKLEVYKRSTTRKVLTVNLNNNGGRKPLDNLTTSYKPTEKPDIRTDISSNVEFERVFYAEIDLAAAANLVVIFNIVPNDNMDDYMRYLSFTGEGAGELDGKSIILNAGGGKKPLGGGLVPFIPFS